MDISVIVPIYGVEKFIEKSLRSLFTQTKTDGVEFILVNDCTKDNSIVIAQRVIAEHPNLDIKLINHEVNRGLAVARQTGLDAAIGDYIYQCDSDDWCEPTLLEDMYKEAKQNDADVVVCDYTKIYPRKSKHVQNSVADNGVDCIKLLLESYLSSGLWIKLIRREIITKNNIHFIPKLNNGEDYLMSVKIFSYAKTVCYVPKPLYNYMTNSNSISNTPDDKTIKNIIQKVDEVEKFIINRGLESELGAALMSTKIIQKHSLLIISRGSDMQKEIAKIFPESDNYISLCQRMHSLNRFALRQAVEGRLRIYNWLLSVKKYLQKISRGV